MTSQTRAAETGAPVGLTSSEAAARRARGEGNVSVTGTSRTYARILRTNVFSFYIMILFTIGVALLALGRWSDALISVGLGVITAGISAAQEIRAKRQLDRLQLLARGTVVVVRDGRETEVPPEAVVRGDVLAVRPGDQLVVDGPVLTGRVEVDESLLTGESEAQVRGPGADLLSGSHCVGGGGTQLARDVGPASYANRLTAQARRDSTDSTPLQQRISFVIRLTMVLVVLMGGAILAQTVLEGYSLLRVVQTSAVLSGLVPYGLFFMIALSYTVGAVSSSREGALVQRVNAVESVSNVDVVCTDKTGTLTTGRLTVTEVLPLGAHTLDDVTAALGAVARSTGAPNLTSAALAAHLPAEPVPVVEEVAFTSSRRWSALRTRDDTWVLGAPEVLVPAAPGPHPDVDVRSRTAQGLRVLVLGRATTPGAPLRGADERPALPELELVALVALADELRPDVPETLARFAAEGIELKVLSGDDPDTVAALATRAGLPDAVPVHAGHLDQLSDAELDGVVAGGTVFGRVAPEQKERIVTSLRRQGRYVAMVGDGVNDALALKAAQVGVAMRSGSAVARDVADIVLTDDSLAALAPARRTGRRIIDGITTSAQVFLARVATQGLVIVVVTMLGLGFPYSPAQGGLTLFTVGLPSLVLTAWARPTAPDPHVLRTLARFVIPAAVLTAAGGATVYAVLYTEVAGGFASSRVPAQVIADFERYTGLTYGVDGDFAAAAATIGAQTGLSTFVSLASVLLVLYLKPPARLFAAWTAYTGDRRPAWLVLGLLVVLVAALVTPVTSDLFGLTGAAPPVYTTVLPALVVWFGALGLAYRLRLMDRLLGLREPAG
ncbi:HAD-IC family P-type ATPase [Modestobacter sp. I12A-02628]|uniref:HAD-IC family P-type ATPase n=1 Tax=Goekera deserti TaxID=2497753 RepID=A0A7K3WJ05_9ACTN|nr:HAD-IC family P-type ATPase [Goekera deserti]MPQ98155.1 HAD-IC family P-type ATPase [Goekera deserti]NDI48804.1 HAD-IC family P-type ATPase [Goekera deserti]NEL56485.1 HAD-IC family P-type ATPase [Goekera deserti]